MLSSFGRLLVLSCVLAKVSNADWQDYIVGPQDPTVYPKVIQSVSGNVVNAEALVGGEGDAIFTRRQGDVAPTVTLDFGVNVVGFVSIAFNGASANTPGIRLAFSETLQFLGNVSDYSRSNMANAITPGSDQIAVKAEPYVWEDTWGCKNGTQVCSDGLHGFRYMRIYLDAIDSDAPITQATGTVNITSVQLKWSAFLATPDTFQGWFVCSDDELNRYWYSGVYTNDLTTDNFRETDVDPRGAYNPGLDGKMVLFDGAKRDRDPYIGDVAVSGRTGYLSHGNLTSIAVRNVLADLANNQREDSYIPSASVMNYTLQLFDYPLWWVVALNDYVLHTNDIEFLKQYYPNLQSTLNVFYPAHTNDASKLLSRPAGYGDYAFVGRDGESSYYNVLYVWALKLGAQCAEWLQDEAQATEWLDRANIVSDAVNEVFWDEGAGAYRNSATSTSHPQDANSIAVLAGVADYFQATILLNYLTLQTGQPYGNAFMDDDSLVDGGSKRVYAFMSTFELRARMMVGFSRTGIDEMKRLYGWMQSHDPNSTYWEGIGADGSMYQGGFTSAAHGWSTGVVGILTNSILGVQFEGPGGSTVRFQPVDDSDITWANGTVPSPYGPVEYDWEVVNSTYSARISLPAGVNGKASVARGARVATIELNNRLVWTYGQAKEEDVGLHDEGYILLDNLSAGVHIITATYKAEAH